MVVHNHRAVWTEEEKKVNYEFGMMYCAVHGFEKFKKMGKNYLFLYLNGFFIFNLFKRVLYFNLTIFIFSKNIHFLFLLFF